MLKKTTLSTVIAATLMSCGAASVSANEFYAGAEAGWSDAHIEATRTNANVNGFSSTGFTYGAIAGYQMRIPDGMLAFEVNVGDNATEYEQKTATSSESMEGGPQYGITAKLGTSIHRYSHLYALAGYQWQDMDAQATTISGGTRSVTTDSATFGGPKVGFGLQTKATRALTLRAEWSRTIYDEETILDSKLDPEESRFTLGIVGKF
ncbi:MAG: Uncharacterized protein AWU57_526 [Marinobacter sp. T13-3]|nr:MAG: Uncharacterized protein AWU57_526 [Marinobacter sp. T13-3]